MSRSCILSVTTWNGSQSLESGGAAAPALPCRRNHTYTRAQLARFRVSEGSIRHHKATPSPTRATETCSYLLDSAVDRGRQSPRLSFGFDDLVIKYRMTEPSP